MRLALIQFFAGVLAAQTVHVYTEFERIDPFGKVVAVDRAETPREILSPALARNAWTTYQVVIEPSGKPYALFIAQNPENTAEVKVYRPVFVKQGDTWVPDRLVPVEVSPGGEVAAIEPQVPGQTALVYWLDLWVRSDAPVRRSRIEVQLNMNERWTIYPMEVRIQEARPAPQPRGRGAASVPLIPASLSSATAALNVLRAYACGPGASGEEQELSVRSLIRRNALQDQSLARSLELTKGRAGVVQGILASIDAHDIRAWCRSPQMPHEPGAEWYLKVRDYLYKASNEAVEKAPLR